MLKIVNSQTDLKGFNQDEFYSVYRINGDTTELVAIASSLEEAEDAHEMLNDLRSAEYHVFLPKAKAN